MVAGREFGARSPRPGTRGRRRWAGSGSCRHTVPRAGRRRSVVAHSTRCRRRWAPHAIGANRRLEIRSGSVHLRATSRESDLPVDRRRSRIASAAASLRRTNRRRYPRESARETSSCDGASAGDRPGHARSVRSSPGRTGVDHTGRAPCIRVAECRSAWWPADAPPDGPHRPTRRARRWAARGATSRARNSAASDGNGPSEPRATAPPAAPDPRRWR